MTMIAYAFLQHQRLKQAKREKKSIPGRRNRPCQLSDAPSSTPSRQSKSMNDVPTAECASEYNRNNSAKVVLVPIM